MTADQKKIMALENRIAELEERIENMDVGAMKKEPRFRVGSYVKLVGFITEVDSADLERHYLVEVRWETENDDDFPEVWLPVDALEGEEDAEDKR